MSTHEPSEIAQFSAGETLSQSDQHYRALIEHSTDITVLLDATGLVTYISPSITPILGYTPQEVVGVHGLSMIHPDDRETMQQVLGGILREPGKSLRAEYRLRHNNGSYCWFEGSGTNLLSVPGVQAIVGNFRDITERRQAEEEQKRQEELKDEFIRMVSHELKTPVTSIKGFTQLLKRLLASNADARVQLYLERMDIQLTKLAGLIRDMLDLSRVQTDKMLYNEELVDLDALVHDIVEQVQATTTTHHLICTGHVSAPVLGDQDRLGQVFINLLSNAIKYSPEADTVVITLSNEGDQALVCIQDFGIGVAEVYHEHIFERFYQVPDPFEKTFPGLGIGLYLSQQIVQRHRGRIWVESRKGQGATFWVSLPVHRSAPKGVEI